MVLGGVGCRFINSTTSYMHHCCGLGFRVSPTTEGPSCYESKVDLRPSNVIPCCVWFRVLG